jgi:hypothetical protein
MNRQNNGMKNSPTVVPASPEQSQGLNGLVRFWACFLLCLAALGLIAGLLLAGFFLLMGYRVF